MSSLSNTFSGMWKVPWFFTFLLICAKNVISFIISAALPLLIDCAKTKWIKHHLQTGMFWADPLYSFKVPNLHSLQEKCISPQVLKIQQHTISFKFLSFRALKPHLPNFIWAANNNSKAIPQFALDYFKKDLIILKAPFDCVCVGPTYSSNLGPYSLLFIYFYLQVASIITKAFICVISFTWIL